VDPLAQLQDIQLPDQIHNYPIAMGWWILAAVIIVMIFFITAKTLKTKRKARAQKQAIFQLTSNEPNLDNSITILKWAALQYFSRNDVANLYGDNFKEFLLEQLPEKHKKVFEQLCATTLESRYQTTIEDKAVQNVHDAAILWLKHALPPKNNHNHLSTTSLKVNS
jgi:hypothetical protein